MNGNSSMPGNSQKPKQRKNFTAAEEDKIIEYYRQHEHLWDPKHADYKIGVKSLTIQTLVQELGDKFTAAEIHHRFSGMRTTYRANANKVAASKTTGSDGKVYLPNWPHFESMSFLDASKATRTSLTSITVHNSTEDAIVSDNDVDMNNECELSGMQIDSELELSQNVNAPSEPAALSCKTSKNASQNKSKTTGKVKRGDDDEILRECINVLRSVNKENESEVVSIDRSAAYGEYVIISLRDMTEWNRTRAMGEITTVLAKYDRNNPESN